jgi:hypothetical protein
MTRQEAKHRRRRIIVNNDGNDCVRLPRDEGVSAERFLESRTSSLVGSQVDSVFYCTGVFNFYTHQSKETELRTGADKGVDDWAANLKEVTGRDSLETMVDFCHDQGWECFWSFRVNDTHDSSKSRLLSQWKQDHPEYLMGERGDTFPIGGGRWSSVNYGLEPVREKVLAILTDVATRYDVDGIELDFFRHPVLFRASIEGDPVADSDMLAFVDLFRQIRSMTEEVAARRGRPFLIGVRIPDSVDYCRALGIDLPMLLGEDLVDIVTGSGYFKLEPWENLATLGKDYDVAVYAAMVARRLMGGGDPDAETDLAVWRGEAYNAWKAGVDGIYTFNRFNPKDPIFREIGDPEALEAAERTDQVSYVAEDCWSRPETWVKDGRAFVCD